MSDLAQAVLMLRAMRDREPERSAIDAVLAALETAQRERDRPDLAARVYAVLVDFFGSNLRGDQQGLHHRLSSIVIEATLRAEKAEQEVAAMREDVRVLQEDHDARIEQIEAIEKQRDGALIEVAALRRMSKRWKELARFRGWPKQEHERNRQQSQRTIAALRRALTAVIENHCPSSAFCSTCTPARELLGARVAPELHYCVDCGATGTGPDWLAQHFEQQHSARVAPEQEEQ